MRRLILIVIVMLLVVTPKLIFAEVVGETNEVVTGISEPILDNILEALKQMIMKNTLGILMLR